MYLEILLKNMNQLTNTGMLSTCIQFFNIEGETFSTLSYEVLLLIYKPFLLVHMLNCQLACFINNKWVGLRNNRTWIN